VTNADPAVAVTYSIRATGILAANVIRLGNAAAVSNYVYQSSSTNRGVDYYLFRVSSNAYQATFETFSTGDVDLYVRKGLPLPDTNIFDYASATPASNRSPTLKPSCSSR